MKSLISRTMLYYAIFSLVGLLLLVPVFYLTLINLYIHDVDEALQLRKDEFENYQLPTISAADIADWNRFNRDTQILPDALDESKLGIVEELFYDTLSVEWEPYRSLYTPFSLEGQDYVLMMRQNLVETEDIVGTIALLFFVIFLVLVSGFLLISRKVSSRLWQPFHRTLTQLTSYKIDEGKVLEFQDSTTTEFQQLNETLSLLIKENSQAYLTQKEFTENASHELQTPLAIFQSKLDLLLQTDQLTENQAQLVDQLYSATARISRINKNLILLGKIDNHQFEETESINIRQCLEVCLINFTEQVDQSGITLDTKIEGDTCLTANRGLIEILINNLLINSLRHNISEGNISVKLQGEKLTISNSGIPSTLDPSALFKRFSKGSKNTQSSGLGLAITKRIADRYQWRIDYHFENDHHLFSVEF